MSHQLKLTHDTASKLLWAGRGYPAYNEHGEHIGHYPGCAVCNQYGFQYIIGPDTEDCPNCEGKGWADWIVSN